MASLHRSLTSVIVILDDPRPATSDEFADLVLLIGRLLPDVVEIGTKVAALSAGSPGKYVVASPNSTSNEFLEIISGPKGPSDYSLRLKNISASFESFLAEEVSEKCECVMSYVLWLTSPENAMAASVFDLSECMENVARSNVFLGSVDIMCVGHLPIMVDEIMVAPGATTELSSNPPALLANTSLDNLRTAAVNLLRRRLNLAECEASGMPGMGTITFLFRSIPGIAATDNGCPPHPLANEPTLRIRFLRFESSLVIMGHKRTCVHKGAPLKVLPGTGDSSSAATAGRRCPMFGLVCSEDLAPSHVLYLEGKALFLLCLGGGADNHGGGSSRDDPFSNLVAADYCDSIVSLIDRNMKNHVPTVSGKDQAYARGDLTPLDLATRYFPLRQEHAVPPSGGDLLAKLVSSLVQGLTVPMMDDGAVNKFIEVLSSLFVLLSDNLLANSSGHGNTRQWAIDRLQSIGSSFTKISDNHDRLCRCILRIVDALKDPGAGLVTSERPLKQRRTGTDIVYPINLGVTKIRSLGRLSTNPNFHTSKYIYPVGFQSTREYSSYINVFGKTTYACEIIDRSGTPEFIVTPDDDKDNVIRQESATGAWKAVVDRINLSRVRQGVQLPNLSGHISGPDYFGYSHPTVITHLLGMDKVQFLSKFVPPSGVTVRSQPAAPPNRAAVVDILRLEFNSERATAFTKHR